MSRRRYKTSSSHRAAARRYYRRHRSKILSARREAHRANPDRFRATWRKWYGAHADELRKPTVACDEWDPVLERWTASADFDWDDYFRRLAAWKKRFRRQ